jgi:hypothetical protein
MFSVFALPCLSCFPFGFVGGFFLLWRAAMAIRMEAIRMGYGKQRIA